jgi:hypothetical protein
MKNYKKALSYIEIILSLIILSIISSITMPKSNDNILEIATDDLISQINYISFLATLEGKCNQGDPNCLGKLWQIRFHTKVNNQDVISYTIFKDKNANSLPNANEYMKDKILNNTINGRRTNSDKQKNSTIFINKLYAIDSIKLSSNCKSGNSFKIMFSNDGTLYRKYYKSIYKLGSSSILCNKKLEENAVCKSKRFPMTDIFCKITLKQGLKESKICIDTKTGFTDRCALLQSI